MTAKNFHAAYNSKAIDSNNWTPGSLPMPGDTLTMSGGSMFVQGGELAGDTLTLSGTDAITLTPNAVLATTTASGVTVNATIDVEGRATATLGQSYPSTANYCVNIGSNSTWLGNYVGTLSGGLVVNGPSSAKFENDGHSGIGGTHATIGVDVVGCGSFTEGSAQGSLGFLEFERSVAAGETVTVAADPYRGKSTLVLDDPADFHAKINLGSGVVDLKNIHGGSYTYHNETLELYSHGHVVKELHIALQAPQASDWAVQPLIVERHGADILISQGVAPTIYGDHMLFNRG